MSETPDDAWREPTNRAVDELAEYARALVGRSASVERQSVGGGLPTLWIEPVNPRSRSVAIIGEQWLIVQLGEQGGRWELGYEESDVALAKGLIAAARAGRVIERVAFARSRVTVTLEDGEKVSEPATTAVQAASCRFPGGRDGGAKSSTSPTRRAYRKADRWSSASSRPLRRSGDVDQPSSRGARPVGAVAAACSWAARRHAPCRCASLLASVGADPDARAVRPMRTTVTLDDELVARAEELTGITERARLLRAGLEALITRESARRLAALGGTDPGAEAAPRRRGRRGRTV